MKHTMHFVIALVFIMFAGIPAAFADSGDLKAEFRELDVKQRRAGIEIDYKITRPSWRAMKKAGVQPRLNLYTKGRRGDLNFRYSVQLDKRKGEIQLPKEIKIRGSKVVELEVIGFNGFYRVANTALGERCAPRLRIALGRGHHDGKGKGKLVDREERNFGPKLVKACKAATDSSNVSRCIAKAGALRHDPIATVKACGANTRWGSDFNRCLDTAATFTRFSAAPSVLACGAATDWASDLNNCMKQAQTHKREPGRIIQACDEATTYSSDLKRCIKNASLLGRNADSVVAACSEGNRWSSSFHSCVEEAGEIRRRG